jgi:TRAP-type C4-dicarboxylate transport system substrate-binding protein
MTLARLCHLQLFSAGIYPAVRIKCKDLIDRDAGTTSLSPARAIAQTASWSMATEYPATTVSGQGIAFFADRLAKESSGKLAIAPAYDAPCGLKSADIVAAIRDGRLAAGCAFAGALGRIDPAFLLSSLPFVATSQADARRLLDAAGLAVFAAAGARPANLAFADVMPRLADGSIQAVLSSGDGGAGRKLWEHLPCFTEIGYALPLSFAAIGQSIYDGLASDLRAIVDGAAAATQAWLWELLTRRMERELCAARSQQSHDRGRRQGERRAARGARQGRLRRCRRLEARRGADAAVLAAAGL